MDRICLITRYGKCRNLSILINAKEITWFSGQIDTFVSSHVLGTMIRGIVDGNMASMALEDTNDDKMEEVISSLIKQAKTVTTKEKDSLRKPEKTEEVVKEKNLSNQVWIRSNRPWN